MFNTITRYVLIACLFGAAAVGGWELTVATIERQETAEFRERFDRWDEMVSGFNQETQSDGSESFGK